MPLYDNILLSKRKTAEEPSKSGSANASMKLLQDHLLSKRRLQQRQNNDSPLRLAQKRAESRSQQVIISESDLHKQSDYDWQPEEEYDPMYPNSFEVLQTEYLKSEELRLAANRKSSSSSNKNRANLLDVVDKLDKDDDYRTTSSNNNKKIKGTAIAPPPSLLSSSSADNITSEKSVDSTTTSSISTTNDKLVGSSVAAKIMSKMGYKVGQGLGKDEQGISSPLEVEKSGLNAGRILPTAPQQTPSKSVSFDIAQVLPEPSIIETEQNPIDSGAGMANLLKESTRVLMLQNMVGPGEVDDDLEAETKEECKKYGEVVKCLIYEIPNKKVPDDEAVRIFVEFRKVESAIKAVNDLNGRYFGGRIVRASFYSVEHFAKYELGLTAAGR